MQPSTLTITLLVLSALAYQLGKRRALAVAEGDARRLHSLPSYYGYLAALWCAIPALVILAIWVFFEDPVITKLVLAGLPPEIRDLSANRLTLVVNDIKNLVSGNIVSGQISPAMQAAADKAEELKAQFAG